MPYEEMVESSAERWDRKAARKRYMCGDCTVPIPYEDRTVFFERGVCAHCAHVRDKEGLFNGAPSS